MEGGPKSLKAGLKLDDDGREGEGTEDPGQKERRDRTHERLNLKHKQFCFKCKILKNSLIILLCCIVND